MQKEKLHRVIRLPGVKNLRTLAGLPSALGGTVREGILYRSAAWDQLTPETGRVLREKYGITLDVDLRTGVEVEKKPDQRVPGIDYRFIPIIRDSLPGISRESDPANPGTMDELPDMVQMYRQLVREQEYIEGFRLALHTIMNHRDGAALWHCTVGKDRCGLTAFFLESILGIDRETCFRDYLLTNRAFAPEALKNALLVGLTTGDIQRAGKVFNIFVARESYLRAAIETIETEFGGMEAYLNNRLQITPEEMETFRRYALEGYPG